MDQDHGAIEELLAGYALRSLSGADADEVDRLLTEHVPSCPRCSETLSEFQRLSGDLALAAPAAPIPEPMLPRLHVAMDDVPLSGRPARRGAFVALAASVAALVAMGGLSFAMAGRASDAQDRTTTALRVLSLMRSPGVSPVSVDPTGGTPAGSGFVEVSAPEIRRLYLVADGCPDPSDGFGYQLWLGTDGEFEPIGEMFWPEDGVVLIELEVDVTRYDAIWITEEPAGTRPTEPNTEAGHTWAAPLS